ncbi:MAG: ParB N-terminal domain-containing protein [Nitrospirae bacterium]|nr:ParB N-terminal domain-containing protein [Nitrospirota bacterium]
MNTVKIDNNYVMDNGSIPSVDGHYRDMQLMWLDTGELNKHPKIPILATSKEDYEKLEMSISKEQGIRNPLVIYKLDGKWVILCGYLRNEIALKLGIKYILCLAITHELSEEQQLEHALTDNLARRHVTQAQKVHLALTIAEMLKEDAAKRRAGAGRANFAKKHRGKDTVRLDSDLTDEDDSEGVAEFSDSVIYNNKKGKALEIAAEMAGISYDTALKGSVITDQSPETWGMVVEGELSINAAYNAIKSSSKKSDKSIKTTSRKHKIYEKYKKDFSNARAVMDMLYNSVDELLAVDRSEIRYEEVIKNLKLLRDEQRDHVHILQKLIARVFQMKTEIENSRSGDDQRCFDGDQRDSDDFNDTDCEASITNN